MSGPEYLSFDGKSGLKEVRAKLKDWDTESVDVRFHQGKILQETPDGFGLSESYSESGGILEEQEDRSFTLITGDEDIGNIDKLLSYMRHPDGKNYTHIRMVKMECPSPFTAASNPL